ncbi:MAG: hypothetical protein HUU50_15530 [Candidatus Brocadiae bacterium]|nr:hypothetical protein [Candidatus Brocadiia bacterium]
MSKYRIALLPGKEDGVSVLQTALEILESLELNAEYIWIDKDFKNIENFKKNLEKMKSTSCALSAPHSFFDPLNSFHPIEKIKEIFALPTHCYFFKAFLAAKSSFAGIVYQNLPKTFSLSPISDNLRNILEYQYPQMSYFANHKKEDIVANLTLNTKSHFSDMVERACRIALQYGFHQAFIIQEEEWKSSVVQDALKIAANFPSLNTKIITKQQACQKVMQAMESPDIFLGNPCFAQTMSYCYDSLKTGFSASMDIGKNYALFMPMEGNGINIGVFLAVFMLLQHLGENAKKKQLHDSLEKFLHEDPAYLSFLETSKKSLHVPLI